MSKIRSIWLYSSHTENPCKEEYGWAMITKKEEKIENHHWVKTIGWWKKTHLQCSMDGYEKKGWDGTVWKKKRFRMWAIRNRSSFGYQQSYRSIDQSHRKVYDIHQWERVFVFGCQPIRDSESHFVLTHIIYNIEDTPKPEYIVHSIHRHSCSAT